MAVREQVFDREHDRCRVPWCFQIAQEWSHLKARGMGGNPDGSRDTTANTVALCRDHHQGLRSLHSGHLKWRFLSARGADGPMAWEMCEKLPKAECAQMMAPAARV